MHHIVTYRLTHDNAENNLIPLCVKHHKIVESLTNHAEVAGSPPWQIKFVMGSILSERKMATAARIKEVLIGTAA